MPPLILKQWASTPPINIDTQPALRNIYQHWTMTQATTGQRSHHTIRDVYTPWFGAMFGEPLTRLTELGSGESAGSSGPVWRRKVGVVNGSAEKGRRLKYVYFGPLCSYVWTDLLCVGWHRPDQLQMASTGTVM